MTAKYADIPAITIFFVLVAVVIIVSVASIFFHGTFFMMGFAPFAVAIGILWILFWIFLIIWFFRWIFGGHRGWYRDERAEWIARERYARGEITKKEFEGIMKKLHEY